MTALVSAEPEISTAGRKGLRVLITNIWLESRGGTESIVRDLALGLLARGHRPIVYSPVLGKVADEIRARGVPTIDDLAKLGQAPDVIHGHHFTPTGEAIIHFPEKPAFFIGHSWQHSVEIPPRFPQIRQYAGVDEGCCDRLVDMEGIPASQVMLLLNAVDLTRVPPRPRALETRPLRAIAFSKFRSHLPVIRAACERAGLEYAELGKGADRVVAHPEEELVRYDIVFAAARCALEALCAGSAVICCDERGLGGLVTSTNYDFFRRNNFGLRILTNAPTVENVLDETRKFNRNDAIAVSTRAREDADLCKWLDRVEEIYYRIIDDNTTTTVDAKAYRRCLHEFLHRALHDELMRKLQELAQECAAAHVEAAAVRRQLNQLRRSRMLRLGQTIRRALGLPHLSV